MTLAAAPFHAEIARAPEEACAFWTEAADGVRLRVALLGRPANGASRGTVLLFPGRTEFVEKYGQAAAALKAAGLACIAIDWRGQGLADRPLADPATGHVRAFAEYQLDVAALLGAAAALGLPEPFFLLAHSMGGGIGLRALHRGLPVQAAAFSGPMWGIALPPVFRPVAQILAALGHSTGFGHSYVPTTRPETYVVEAAFEGNTLTRDPEMFDWMKRQLAGHPELALGGPSMTWLNEALRELRVLRGLPPPDVPCLTWVGANERIVDTDSIRRLMRNWRRGTLHVVPDAEHELMMEVPAIRGSFLDAVAGHFGAD